MLDQWLFYHSNHVNSNSLITDSSGTAISRIHYLPFGEIDQNHSAGEEATTFKFTGQELDEEVDTSGDDDLMYYNARYYDPALGRFLSADTIVPDPKNIQAFNRYTYVYNSPIKYTDPTGHAACLGLCIAGIIVLSAAIAGSINAVDHTMHTKSPSNNSTIGAFVKGSVVGAASSGATLLIVGTGGVATPGVIVFGELAGVAAGNVTSVFGDVIEAEITDYAKRSDVDMSESIMDNTKSSATASGMTITLTPGEGPLAVKKSSFPNKGKLYHKTPKPGGRGKTSLYMAIGSLFYSLIRDSEASTTSNEKTKDQKTGEENEHN